MATGKLLVRLADGARMPFPREALVRLFDGAGRQVHAASHPKPNIEFTIPVSGGLNDRYRVFVTAKDHLDAGQTAIPLQANATSIIDVMLIPKRSRPLFRPLSELGAVHPGLRDLIEAFLQRTLGAAGEESYQQLQSTNPAGLITFLNIASAFGGVKAPDHPLAFVEELFELNQDRFFARAKEAMFGFLRDQTLVFKGAPATLHPNAFGSFKEHRFPEGNVQFTFSQLPDAQFLRLDGDIDLFADTASHVLLEVLPNDVFNPSSKTDPRRAYAMRWMSVQRRRIVDSNVADFDPPFSLVMT
jgi:hypothetical protein